jgi:hypothetical protein
MQQYNNTSCLPRKAGETGTVPPHFVIKLGNLLPAMREKPREREERRRRKEKRKEKERGVAAQPVREKVRGRK